MGGSHDHGVVRSRCFDLRIQPGCDRLSRSAVSSVVPRVVEGRPLPATLPGGAVEARRSRVARAPSRSDAEGALDLGGTAPQAARHRRRHPQKRHKSPHDPLIASDRVGAWQRHASIRGSIRCGVVVGRSQSRPSRRHERVMAGLPAARRRERTVRRTLENVSSVGLERARFCRCRLVACLS